MNCYLCQNPMSFFMYKNGYTIYRCPACGLAETNLNRNYESFVKEHYGRGYFTGNPQCSAYANYKDDKPYIVRNMKKFLSRVRSFKPSGKLLDVGCAMGFFVELALSAGYDAYGFDPSEYATSKAKKLLGKRIKIGTIQSIKYKPKSFDVITLFDVFEHLGDPRQDLLRLKGFLKDDGIIVIATGDSDSYAAKVLKRRWTFFIPPQHLFFFNRKNIDNLFRSISLAPLLWFRIGKWLSLRYILHLARTTGESKLAQKMYGLIHRNGIGRSPLYLPMHDNMVVIVGKKT